MLRITTVDHGPRTTLRLEGRLIGDWVDELERCCIGIKTANPHGKLELEMSDVEFIDKKGEALLERLYLDGAELCGGNLFTRSIITGIVEHSKTPHGS